MTQFKPQLHKSGKWLILILLSCFTFSLSAQEENETVNFLELGEKPVLVGCEDIKDESQRFECLNTNVNKFIGSNFNYPEKARKKGIQARIYVTFIIEKDGSLSSIKVLRSAASQYQQSNKKMKLASLLDEEAVRVVSLLRFAKPGYFNGKPVRVQYTLPINAKLQ